MFLILIMMHFILWLILHLIAALHAVLLCNKNIDEEGVRSFDTDTIKRRRSRSKTQLSSKSFLERSIRIRGQFTEKPSQEKGVQGHLQCLLHKAPHIPKSGMILSGDIYKENMWFLWKDLQKNQTLKFSVKLPHVPNHGR